MGRSSTVQDFYLAYARGASAMTEAFFPLLKTMTRANLEVMNYASGRARLRRNTSAPWAVPHGPGCDRRSVGFLAGSLRASGRGVPKDCGGLFRRASSRVSVSRVPAGGPRQRRAPAERRTAGTGTAGTGKGAGLYCVSRVQGCPRSRAASTRTAQQSRRQ